MSQVGFQAASAAVAVVAPSRGRVEVLRSGHRGRDAAVAAPGHGWPMAAGPRSRTGARAWRALASHRTKGARALWLLWGFSKVTRRKGETNSSHHRRNGYTHQQSPPPFPIRLKAPNGSVSRHPHASDSQYGHATGPHAPAKTPDAQDAGSTHPTAQVATQSARRSV